MVIATSSDPSKGTAGTAFMTLCLHVFGRVSFSCAHPDAFLANIEVRTWRVLWTSPPGTLSQ